MKLKKILLGFIMVLGVLVTVSSAAKPEKTIETGLLTGQNMPRMKSRMSDLTDLTPNNEQKFTLVHFWAAYDNNSRAKNVLWNHYFSRSNNKIGYRAVSLDPNESVFKGTLALDHIDLSNQSIINVADREQVIDLYGLKHSFHSYLIDEKGIVRAVDPTPDQLNDFN